MRFEPEIAQRVERLAEQLKKRGWRMATAESCTGGWIAKACTDLAGSSAWFEQGFVTYSNRAKQQQTGVSPEAIEQHGAVSERVALEMALGAQRVADTQVAVSVTGIAGPDGGSPDKPVGTVWFGFAVQGREAFAERLQFVGDRHAVRAQTVLHALSALLSQIENDLSDNAHRR